MLLSRALGRLSARLSLLQVTGCEAKPALARVNGPLARSVCMSNNMELPAQYEVASQRLSSVLGCTKQECCAILMEFPQIKRLNHTNLSSRCEYLVKDLGISADQVVTFPWLLQLSKKMLQERVRVLAEKTKCAMSSLVPLMQYSPEKLQKMFADTYKEDPNALDCARYDRISYLSDKLDCSELEACDIISKHNFLLKAPLERLEAVFELFDEHSISQIDIIRDIWILRYKPEQIKTRLEVIKSIGMDNAKPWLTRSTEQVFQRSLMKYKKNEELLGRSMDKMAFVKKQLQIDSEKEALEITRKSPILLKMSPYKLKGGLEALLGAGFTLKEIKATPRVLAYSSRSILQRHELLTCKFAHRANLSVLTSSSSIFQRYVSKLEIYAKIRQEAEKFDLEKKT